MIAIMVTMATEDFHGAHHVGVTRMDEHVCLNGHELFEFRTRQCPLYAKGVCSNSSRCNMSHSETWPRRNPLQFAYDYKLCPNIQFFRTDNKMQLHGKCNYGRRCKFSHSKEEQLYHPDLYKTRMCLNFPNCKGYYCPFAHSQSELRQQGIPIVRRCFEKPMTTMEMRIMDPMTIMENTMSIMDPMTIMESTIDDSFFGQTLDEEARDKFKAFTGPRVDHGSPFYKIGGDGKGILETNQGALCNILETNQDKLRSIVETNQDTLRNILESDLVTETSVATGTPTNSPIVPPSKFNVVPDGLANLDALLATLATSPKLSMVSRDVMRENKIVATDVMGRDTMAMDERMVGMENKMVTMNSKMMDTGEDLDEQNVGILNQTLLHEITANESRMAQMCLDNWKGVDTISLHSTTCSPTVHSQDALFTDSSTRGAHNGSHDLDGTTPLWKGAKGDVMDTIWDIEDDKWFDTVIKAGLKLLGDDSVFGPGEFLRTS